MKFLGIDLGTSSVKIVVMNEEGKVVGSLSKEYSVDYPKLGWAQQNPEEWWINARDGIKEVLANNNINPFEIKGVGLSGQMHGLVLLDSDNKILMPAILWCDQRTQAECDYLNNVIGQENLSKYVGNKALTGFTLPKILWVKKNEPEVYNKIAHILLPKDYIRFKLTGEFASDVSDASGMLMFDVKNRKWSNEILEILDIKQEVLPKVYESFQVTGTISKEISRETGLTVKTIVVGGAGDQAAGAVGTGTVEAGIISVSLGTSGVVFACAEKYSVDKGNKLHSFCHSNGKWHQMGVILSAASCLKWWVDTININITADTFDNLLKEAEAVKAGSNGLLFLPYLMGERTPHSDANAKGSFIGLTMIHKRADMTRAILEGVCFALRDSLEILKSINVPVKRIRVSGGGSRSRLWRQILSDVFNLPVDVINSKEGAAYGAAILAAVGCGTFASVDEACNKLIKVTDTVYPNEMNQEKYDDMYKIYSGLYDVLKNTFEAISKNL